MTTVPIAASDLTWLNMDRPTNLMVVNGLMWFDEEPDWEAVREVLRSRLVEGFPVMSQRPRQIEAGWVWEDDPGFDFDRQVRHVTLPAPGDRAAAEDYISSRVSQPLDRDHPLWEFDLISGYTNAEGAQGALVLARFHHVLADGIRIVQLILGLCDVDEGAAPTAVGRTSTPKNPVALVAGATRDIVGNMASFAGDVALAALSAVPKVPGMVGGLGRTTFYEGYGLVVKPTRVTDAVSALSSEDNVALNTWRSASRLTLWGGDSRLIADQAPDVAKRVSWVAGIDLDEVKTVGAAHNATVNDVLLGAVSLGLSAYLKEKGRPIPSETNFLVPIALKPMDTSMPKELGNHFALVMFPMPLGISEVDVLLGEVRTRMMRIKNSAEAMLVFGVQRAIAETPTIIAQNLTQFVANKSIGLLTNVPGPRAPIYLAGARVAGMLGWVPTSSDQSIGLCIFSYNGHVNIGITTDAGIMPDPDHLEELIQASFADMVAAS